MATSALRRNLTALVWVVLLGCAGSFLVINWGSIDEYVNKAIVPATTDSETVKSIKNRLISIAGPSMRFESETLKGLGQYACLGYVLSVSGNKFLVEEDPSGNGVTWLCKMGDRVNVEIMSTYINPDNFTDSKDESRDLGVMDGGEALKLLGPGQAILVRGKLGIIQNSIDPVTRIIIINREGLAQSIPLPKEMLNLGEPVPQGDYPQWIYRSFRK